MIIETGQQLIFPQIVDEKLTIGKLWTLLLFSNLKCPANSERKSYIQNWVNSQESDSIRACYSSSYQKEQIELSLGEKK